MAPPGSWPLVCCVILNRNGMPFFQETLDTVSGMDYPNLRVMMIDNDSSDGSADFVRKHYPHITLIENSENLGIAAARNAAMTAAFAGGAEWVYHLDNDVKADPRLLSRLMETAAGDPRIGILGPKIYYHARPGVLWYAGGQINYFTGIVSHRGIRKPDVGQYDREEDTDYVVGCSFLVARKVIEAVGAFDTVYDPFFTQDSDLCVRASRAGFRVVYVPEARIWHRVSTSSGGVMTPARISMKVEYNLILFKRHARWYHWLTIPWCIGGLALLFLGREIGRGNFGVIAALFRGFKKALGRMISPDRSSRQPR